MTSTPPASGAGSASGPPDYAPIPQSAPGPQPILPETAAGRVWLARPGPHTGYAAGVLGPLILAAIGRAQ